MTGMKEAAVKALGMKPWGVQMDIHSLRAEKGSVGYRWEAAIRGVASLMSGEASEGSGPGGA